MITQERAESSGRVAEDQPIKIGVVTQRVQIVVVLSTNAKIRLQVERALQRLEREINGAETSASGGESVMNVSCLGFAFECALKHLLRRDILAAIQFNDAAVVKRVGVARQHAFGAQARLGNREVRTCTGGHFRNLRVLIDQNAKLVASLREPATHKLFVSSFERSECR